MLFRFHRFLFESVLGFRFRFGLPDKQSIAMEGKAMESKVKQRHAMKSKVMVATYWPAAGVYILATAKGRGAHEICRAGVICLYVFDKGVALRFDPHVFL